MMLQIEISELDSLVLMKSGCLVDFDQRAAVLKDVSIDFVIGGK